MTTYLYSVNDPETKQLGIRQMYTNWINIEFLSE